MLEVIDIRYVIDRTTILDGVSTRFKAGQVSMIIGPNGSGKSTLLKIAGYEFSPTSGSVRYGGRSRHDQDRQSLAMIRAVLSQSVEIPFPLSVEEVVMMGRYPHFSVRPSASDRDISVLAMRAAGVERLYRRNYRTLSGGEKQMVQFARVLAQIWEKPDGECRYLLLDEPTTFLDINHQHHMLGVLRTIAADDVVVVAVMHDINLAAQYADRLLALYHGAGVAEGAPEEVIVPEIFRTLYQMNGRRIASDDLEFPLIVFKDRP